MPTADKSNHSAAGTIHAHHSATCVLYVTLRCLIGEGKIERIIGRIIGNFCFSIVLVGSLGLISPVRKGQIFGEEE